MLSSDLELKTLGPLPNSNCRPLLLHHGTLRGMADREPYSLRLGHYMLLSKMNGHVSFQLSSDPTCMVG
jgi:hypothetical protein